MEDQEIPVDPCRILGRRSGYAPPRTMADNPHVPELSELLASRGARVAVSLGLLLAFGALRLATATNHPLDLLEPEELLNLRLARQLAADLPLGSLSDYWYGGVGGASGAGTLVLSFLFIPIVWLFDADVGALRTMGSLWAFTTALLLAGIGRELFGPRGFIAGLVAALCAPPLWLHMSLMARGNYTEAAALSLAALYLLLLVHRLPAQLRGYLAAFGLGWMLIFGAWFAPSAGPPSLVLGVLTSTVVLRKGHRTLMATLSGVLLATLLALSGLAPEGNPDSPVPEGAHRDAVVTLVTSPNDWPAFLAGALLGQPVLAEPDSWWADLPSGQALEPLGTGVSILLALGYWMGLGSLALRRRHDPAPLHRRLGPALILLGLALPIGLGAIGVGPDRLPVESLYFFDPRRAALVYLLWALGLLSLLCPPAGASRWRRWSGPTIASVGLLFSLVYALSGKPLHSGFHPERYMLCTENEPRLETAVCITVLMEEQVAGLERALDSSRFGPEAQPTRAALLEGFESVDTESSDCRLRDPDLPSRTAARAPALRTAVWEGVGLAASPVCGPDVLTQLCSEALDAESVVACESGASWHAGSPK